MAADLKLKAEEAFGEDDFGLAVELYTRALDAEPDNADLLADRAQANIELHNFTEAVADTNRAIELDPSLSEAYLRKCVACVNLEEYQTAKTALEAGMVLVPGDSRFTKWMKDCDERIAEETGAVPPKVNSKECSISSPQETNAASATIGMSTPVAPAKPKYRHDHYNTPTEIVLTIFAKGVAPENVHVEFGEQILSVSIDLPGGDSYHFHPRLFAKIIPSKCRYKVSSSKIEIHLSKADAIAWTSLEFTKDRAVPQKIIVPSTLAPTILRPSYPSKSKTDWDKLEAQVKREEKEEKLDGDAALNKFFRDIYRDADDDTKRAMQKSFVESNGTVLSTNWKDVGAEKVEGSPPEGMELKKWEY